MWVLYGISSAPGWFQGEMKRLFSDIDKIDVFFDDIKIKAETKKRNDKILWLILEWLGNAGLNVQLEKYGFAKNRIQYLEFDVEQNGLHISKDRIKAPIEI